MKTKRKQLKSTENSDPRLRILALGLVLLALVMVGRLFYLMVLNHTFYRDLANGSHELYAQLFPRRGSVFIQNTKTHENFPIAMNQDVFLLFADTRKITSDEEVDEIIEVLSEMFEYEEEKKQELFVALNKRDDPYEPIEQTITEDQKIEIEEKELPGLNFTRKQKRFYPEQELAAQVVGFVGQKEDGSPVGRYGVEGYWNDVLAGNQGFLAGIRTRRGSLITSAQTQSEQAQDGSDIYLTIDRTLQFQACEALKKGLDEYQAQSATLIMLRPQTGEILAMCNVPEFNPNQYNEVADIRIYNNNAIFTPYEPGSIFKPLVMAAAINEELVSPNSVFHDTGEKADLCQKPIKNANGRIYGDQSMTGVLENSINTGMVYVAEQLGKKRLVDYIENFGLGIQTGIRLQKEVSGTIDSLAITKGNEVSCYEATASFGQGITATPLQMVNAFAAIANGGKLMQPYVVDKVVNESGKTEKTEPKVVEQVLSSRAASLTSGMLVSVVDSGHAGKAAVEGYYVAGKTGTAQIAERGVYTKDTNHSFVGFAPIDNPEFVLIIKYEKPQRAFSSETAATTFGEIAKFTLQYFGVAPSR